MRRIVMTLLLAALGALCATALLAGSKYVTLCFEAEDAHNVSGKAWSVMKRAEDPSGKVSGKKVLGVPFYGTNEKPPRDEVVYKVKIPQTGVYYLWARTFWKNGCGNSFYIKIDGDKSGDWIIGGDGTYNSMHWVCLKDGGDNSSEPRRLKLSQGVVTFVVASKESATLIDQFVLTTDKELHPANIYKPTPDVLAKDEKAEK